MSRFAHEAAPSEAVAGTAVQNAPFEYTGRVAELAELRADLARAAAGAGGLTLISGEAGIGKTRRARSWRPPSRPSTG